ncbi:hypothetical protein LQ327_01680 [Actinomycetospora endophytica]|uniref:RDD family protein n=1 Tax=Actinomycetospora endophytica TaxID=2291215 RepID=A0ABS8P1G5_9PSEU|nr:hypothetical protein [Actinomycetospora endophytica]MCD2192102.1 hypothetical protein [Actinomycetospora endophytica]
MKTEPTVPAFRYDAGLRAVIWTDALLSALVAAAAMLSPVVIVFPPPPEAATVIGVVVLVAALLLAALGAVTAALLGARMAAGHGHIPPGLRLPLPAAMRPDLPGPGQSVAAPPRSRWAKTTHRWAA